MVLNAVNSNEAVRTLAGAEDTNTDVWTAIANAENQEWLGNYYLQPSSELLLEGSGWYMLSGKPTGARAKAILAATFGVG